jgi:signal transduction histidine kinase
MSLQIRRQTKEMAALEKRLEKETARRKAAEESLKASKRHYSELLARSHVAREEKRLLARQVLLDQEQERRRISRALHDEISQTLSGINVKLAAFSQDASSPQGFKRRIAGARRLVEKSVDIVHRFALGLRPTLLDDLGLIPALHADMKTLTKRTGLQIRFTAFAGVEKLDNDKRTALYRVVQSALANIAKHAKATIVTVDLQKSPEGIRLKVHDDGKSFQVEEVLQAKRYKRLGLISMRERMEMFGGSFRIESSPGKGTTVHACIPINKAQAQT